MKNAAVGSVSDEWRKGTNGKLIEIPLSDNTP